MSNICTNISDDDQKKQSDCGFANSNCFNLDKTSDIQCVNQQYNCISKCPQEYNSYYNCVDKCFDPNYKLALTDNKNVDNQ